MLVPLFLAISSVGGAHATVIVPLFLVITRLLYASTHRDYSMILGIVSMAQDLVGIQRQTRLGRKAGQKSVKHQFVHVSIQVI